LNIKIKNKISLLLVAFLALPIGFFQNTKSAPVFVSEQVFSANPVQIVRNGSQTEITASNVAPAGQTCGQSESSNTNFVQQTVGQDLFKQPASCFSLQKNTVVVPRTIIVSKIKDTRKITLTNPYLAPVQIVLKSLIISVNLLPIKTNNIPVIPQPLVVLLAVMLFVFIFFEKKKKIFAPNTNLFSLNIYQLCVMRC